MDEPFEVPEDDPFWDEIEKRNTGEFWKVEEGERDQPSILENVLDTVTIPKVSEATESRSHSHRARRPRRGRVWVPVTIGALSVAILGGSVWATVRPYATPLRGNNSGQGSQVVTVTPSPSVMSIPGPIVTRWRTRKVEVPGPTVTKTLTPKPSVSTRFRTVEPDVYVSPGPTVTVTATVTEEIDDGRPFQDGG
jgi:hypothetical protein